MEIWYTDEQLTIGFGCKPSVRIRYALPSDTKATKDNIKKYPFVNVRTLDVLIKYKPKHQSEQVYKFTIPKGYKFDGATIPRFLWRIVGSNTQPEFLVGALVHDQLCEHHQYVGGDRRLSTLVFRALIEQAGVSKFKARIMSEAVDVFQRTQGWKNN